MKMQDVLDLVDRTEMPRIRAGETHRFNDIWIVVVEDRLFCRQYSFAEKSWYHAFQKDPRGAIKCGETVTPVRGVVPDDLDEINPRINQAYLEKYAQRFPTYPHYAREMTGPRFMASTLELVPEVGDQGSHLS